MSETPIEYTPVTVDELRAAIDAIYADEFLIGYGKAQRERAKQRTRGLYNAVIAISYGFTPYRRPGSERAYKAICDQCGHAYVLRNKGMMRRHAMEKHGREYGSFPSITTLLEREVGAR